MNEEQRGHEHDLADEQELISRREYLVSLKKWSKAVIGAVVLGGAALGSTTDAGAAGWINTRGNWGNGWRNGGGRVWVNYRGGWRNGSAGWRNGSGGWSNSWDNGGRNWNNKGNTWNNRGGSWDNGSGGGWRNRY